MTACRFCGDDPDRAVLGRWTLWLPMAAPSQNQIAQNKGAARFRYRKVRDEAFQWVFVALNRLDALPPPATGPRRVRLVRVRQAGAGERAYDRGNLVGGLKPVLDALVHHKLLMDDSPRHLVDHYADVVGEHRGVLVEIEELSPEAARAKRARPRSPQSG